MAVVGIGACTFIRQRASTIPISTSVLLYVRPCRRSSALGFQTRWMFLGVGLVQIYGDGFLVVQVCSTCRYLESLVSMHIDTYIIASVYCARVGRFPLGSSCGTTSNAHRLGFLAPFATRTTYLTNIIMDENREALMQINFDIMLYDLPCAPLFRTPRHTTFPSIRMIVAALCPQCLRFGYPF